MSTEPNVKATPVNGLVSFVRGELSPQQFAAVLAALPPEQARHFSGELIASAMVPLGALNAFTKAAAAQKGEPVTDFAIRAGRFGGELGLKTVYKFILALMSPQSVLRAAPLMWKKVYDSGEVVVEATEQSAVIHVRQFVPDPAGCGRITGWFTLIAERSTTNARVAHKTCGARGDGECTWEFHWGG
ncbi:MAG: hypothetical protein NDJ94_05290 [Vicinamibacteria bacterium]|nr:hypothetical protein [Vicinamibacteria bacterium]